MFEKPDFQVRRISFQEVEGGALEGLVVQHLWAWNAYSGDRCQIYFWRTKSGKEVDFVVYGEDTFCAIEVKNAAKVHAKMLKGLLSFREDYPEQRPVFFIAARSA